MSPATLLLATVLVVGLVACGQPSSGDAGSDAQPTEDPHDGSSLSPPPDASVNDVTFDAPSSVAVTDGSSSIALDGGAFSAPEAGVPVHLDGGTDGTYPAFAPDVGRLVYNNGPTIKAPKIVTISWPGEPNANGYEAFGDLLGQTRYWSSITSEYGVGAASSGASDHVRMTNPLPASVRDDELFNIVQVNASQTASNGVQPDPSKWPAPDPSTIYVLYVPTTTKVMFGQKDACASGFSGVHSNLLGKPQFPFAIITPCSFGIGSLFETATAAASHEIAECALDPEPGAQFGWKGIDEAHFAWDLFAGFQDENADLCETDLHSYYAESEPALGFQFHVQRQWSNASAAAGHAPCVPNPDTYFSATLLAPQNILVDLSSRGGSKTAPTTGVDVPVGGTATFAIGLYSDAPHDPWTISAVEGNPFSKATPTHNLKSISLDRTTGQNGDIAHVTVTVDSAGDYSTELMTIVSSKGGQPCDAAHPNEVCTYTPILIGSH